MQIAIARNWRAAPGASDLLHGLPGAVGSIPNISPRDARYQDPYSNSRLVSVAPLPFGSSSIGLHHKRWTRQQTINYILANQPSNPREADRDTGRYIVNPGQATAYMIGQMEILRLRAEAQSAMGDRFTMPGFHDAVLENGAVPLDMLGELVREWSASA